MEELVKQEPFKARKLAALCGARRSYPDMSYVCRMKAPARTILGPTDPPPSPDFHLVTHSLLSGFGRCVAKIESNSCLDTGHSAGKIDSA